MLFEKFKKRRSIISKENGYEFEIIFDPLRNRITVDCIKQSGLLFRHEIDVLMDKYNLPLIDDSILTCVYKGDENDFERIVNEA